MRLIVRNARLRHREGTFDIVVDNERISEIRPDKVPYSAEREIDARGMLVVNSFVNTHVHLDKCLTNEWVRSASNAKEGSSDVIPLAKEIKRSFTEDDIIKRASRATEGCVAEGTLAIRTFADVDTIGGLKAVNALLKVKKRFESFVDLQVVAFPQEGIVRDPGTEELLHQAMELGADVVGGIPWYEKRHEDARKHTDIAFEIAKRYDKDIHMLVDDTEDPNTRNLEYLIGKTLAEKYHGRVSASHCRGELDSPNDDYAEKIVSLARDADISVIENPHISLLMYGRLGTHPRRRGITRVREFMKAGVNVAIGQDDIADPYYPFGRGDMVELAFFMIHGAHLSTPSEIEAGFDMITNNGARAMRLPNYGINVGDNANLVILNASDVVDTFRTHAEKLWVVRNGKPIAENECHRELHLSS